MTPSGATTELILLPSLRAQRGAQGRLVMTRKYLDGAAEFARSWPGPVTSLVRIDDQPTGDFDRIEVEPGEMETALEERPGDPAALGRRLGRAAMALGFLSPEEAPMLAICREVGAPVVFTSEYSPRTERQIADAEVANPLRRLRRKLWLMGAERTRRRMLPAAAGVQCSGTPTFDIYRRVQPNALLFFDNRVPRADIISDAALDAKCAAIARGAPLRLVFGGRFVAMKGVLELPRVAQALRALGAPFTLDIYGDGPLEAALRARIDALGLGDRVTLRGPLDFRTGWLPALRRDTDVFLCCHPQGDPSSTYPEVMSCGVPVAGYDNEAFAGILRHSDGGWMSPINDAARLAAILARLHGDRREIVAAARRARAFAAGHAFETTFARRIDHLVAASRLPERLKTRALSA